MDVHIFGDQTEEVDSELTTLLTSQQDPFLDSFFARSYDAIQAELSGSPLWDQCGPSRCSCLQDLLAMKRSHSRTIPLDHALTTTYHLGVFIKYGTLSESVSRRRRRELTL